MAATMTRRAFSTLGAGFAAASMVGSCPSPAQTAPNRTVRLPDGTRVSALGQGSSHLGRGRYSAAVEEDAIRTGIGLGLTVIDTAELYGGGRAEEMIGHVIAGRRNQVFIVSKVSPEHATPAGIREACAGSLGRLQTDHLDLYLLHRRGDVSDLGPVVETFEELRGQGKIHHWGVSNFDVSDMEDLMKVPRGGQCATNQVEYSLQTRDIERGVLPWCVKHGMPIMAYSPLGGSGADLMGNATVKRIAAGHNVKPSAVVLAWTMRSGHSISIPEAGSVEHVRENAAALMLELTEEDLQQLDRAFPV
ncbi:MAG TPA: aldo/keto reductase [Stellaceae bacterium]|jgi:diketogulonate reductase-like aldo/keto reductase|nr:aldo/keto reductase [Stellaceae bacterium]